MLAGLGGSCTVPVGALGRAARRRRRLRVHGLVASGDGRVVIRLTSGAATIPRWSVPRSPGHCWTRAAAAAIDGVRRPERLAATRVTVYLVGAGPGDPAAHPAGRRVAARADVVLYDRLVNPAVLDLAPPRPS